MYVSLRNRRGTCPRPIHKSSHSDLKTSGNVLVRDVFLNSAFREIVNMKLDGHIYANGGRAVEEWEHFQQYNTLKYALLFHLVAAAPSHDVQK